MKVDFEPLSNYLLCDVRAKKETKIVAPDGSSMIGNSENFEVVVIRVSEDVDNEGNPMVRRIKENDVVCLSATALSLGQEVKLHGKGFFLVRETEIIGLYEEGYDDDRYKEKTDKEKMIVN